MDDLIESINRQVPEKAPLKDRIRAGANLAEAADKGKDAISKSLDALRGGAAALWSAYRNPRSSILLPAGETKTVFGSDVSDYERAVGRWSGADNASALDLYRFRKAYQSKVTDPVRDQAITIFNQAGGDEATMRGWAEEAARNDAFKNSRKAFDAALKLTDAEKTIARNITSRNDETLTEAQQAGLLSEGRENYMMQVWDGVPEMQAKARAQANFTSLGTKPSFTKERKLDSYFDGIKLGYTPKNMSAGFLTETHERAFRTALANRAFIHALFEGKASDGRPLVVVSDATASPVEPDAAHPDPSYMVRPNAKPDQSIGDYRSFDHPSLRGWNWVANVNGSNVIVQSDARVHPEIYRHLTNNLKRSWLQDVSVKVGDKEIKPGAAALAANAALKQAILSIVPARFHRTTLELHAAEHRTNPWNLVDLDLGDKDQRALVDGGLMVANYDGQDGWTDGLGATSTMLKHIPLYGTWAQAHSDALFKEFLPRVKMTTGLNAFARNRARYTGKYTDEKTAQITAKEMNAAFGGLNYRMLGRNKTVQDVMRLAVLAPDFLEARGRFVGQGVRPQGAEQLHAYLLGGLVLYAGIALLNTATDGNPHLDKPMTLVVGHKEYEFRTVQMDTVHAATDPLKFMLNRRAPLLKAATDQAMEDKHYLPRHESFGSKAWRTASGTVSQNVPIPLQPWVRNSHDSVAEKASETILKMAGVNVRNTKKPYKPRR